MWYVHLCFQVPIWRPVPTWAIPCCRGRVPKTLQTSFGEIQPFLGTFVFQTQRCTQKIKCIMYKTKYYTATKGLTFQANTNHTHQTIEVHIFWTADHYICTSRSIGAPSIRGNTRGTSQIYPSKFNNSMVIGSKHGILAYKYIYIKYVP